MLSYGFYFRYLKDIISNITKLSTFQVLMKNDYDHPAPMPEDLFRVYDIDGPEHGYFMAGTKGTGS
jgi:hypothetical protein